MRRMAGLSCLVAAGITAAGCGGKAYDPWLVPEQDFAATVRTIALVSVAVPDDLEDPEPVQATFDSLLAAELQAAGFAVVPGMLTGEIWQRLVDSIGGYYDPFTGRRDRLKYDVVRGRWAETLRERHEADAALFPSVVVVDATVEAWKASWDGTSQSVEPWGRVVLMLLEAVASGLAGNEAQDARQGTVAAFSLEVQLERLDGEMMYVNRGGIEAWEMANGQRVARDRLFQDDQRHLKAVRTALGSIITPRELADGRSVTR